MYMMSDFIKDVLINGKQPKGAIYNQTHIKDFYDVFNNVTQAQMMDWIADHPGDYLNFRIDSGCFLFKFLTDTEIYIGLVIGVPNGYTFMWQTSKREMGAQVKYHKMMYNDETGVKTYARVTETIREAFVALCELCQKITFHNTAFQLAKYM